MGDLMDTVGLLIADTTRLTFACITPLYEYFGIGSIFIICLFLFGAYRFFLQPMLGGSISSRGSDKAQREIHKDKKESGNG